MPFGFPSNYYNRQPRYGTAGSQSAPTAGPSGAGTLLPLPTYAGAGTSTRPAGPSMPVKAYREDFGLAMSDAEYQDAIRGRQEQEHQTNLRRQGETQRQQAQIAQESSPAAIAGLLGAAGVNQITAPANFPSAVTSGVAPISQPAYEAQQQTQLQDQLTRGMMERQASLAQDAWGRKLGAIKQLGGSGQPGQPQIQHPSAGMGGQETGARAAAFARAKEIAGQNALAALRSIQQLSESTGTMGSTGPGLEGGMLADVVGGTAGAINDYGREQLIQDLNRAAQISDMQYQGGIVQRGQDLNRQQVLLGLLAGGGLY